jgi:DNA-binding response OmpR family regulator
MQRVLVIDDSQSCRAAVRLAFEHDGTKVLEAVDGEQGLLAAGPHRPDLIVVGLSLAVICGLELVRGLRVAAPNARIVVVSCDGVSEAALHAGADAVVTRPVNVACLQRAACGRDPAQSTPLQA